MGQCQRGISHASSLTCWTLFVTLFKTFVLVWNRKALLPLLATGLFETLGILTVIIALSVGPVVVVAPIAATYPLWVLLGTVIFSRDLEQVNMRTFSATLSIVVGTTAIYLAN